MTKKLILGAILKKVYKNLLNNRPKRKIKKSSIAKILFLYSRIALRNARKKAHI